MYTTSAMMSLLLTRSNQRLEAVVAQQANLLSRVVEVLEIKHNKQCPPSPSSESIATPLFFSDSMENLKKDASIQEVFVAFFYRRCMEGYQLELQSQEYNSKLDSGKNKVKGQYKRLKKVIKVMLFFCESYPPFPPDDVGGFNLWHKKLTEAAEQATSELIAALTEANPTTPKRITQAYIQKSPIVSAWDNPRGSQAKYAPPNTPQSALSHFNFVPNPKK